MATVRSVLRSAGTALRLRPAQPREDHAHLRRLPIKSGPVNRARQLVLRTANVGVTAAYGIYRSDPMLWRFTARNYHPALEKFARLNAWMICQHASLDVPAYQDYLAQNGFTFRWWDLQNYTPTSKDDYVRTYSEAARCWDGRIETAGTVVDESSGSSGTPFNWLRSAQELNTVHKNVAGYVTTLFGSRTDDGVPGPSRRPVRTDLFCINAFSMGAWATGTNTGLAMAKIAMVKNTGPDVEKIVDTMRHFGPGFTYLITAYPPFLKHLVDRFDAADGEFDEFILNGFVGGEAMTEGLRDYLQRRFHRVYSGYGASDLTIGMGGETDLSVTLRRELERDSEFRARLLGTDEHRTPMIFQYNPLETYMETDENSNLVVTINSASVMSPRLRYNIGDEARIISFPEMVQLTSDFPELVGRLKRAYRAQKMKLPFLLLFGRSDSTISYMGANIYPLDVQNGLYRDPETARLIESFQIELADVGGDEHRPTLHIQLRDAAVFTDAALDDAARHQLERTAADGVMSHLATVSRDVAESLQEDPAAGELSVVVHPFGTGPFSHHAAKIKNVYLTRTTEVGP